MSTIEVQRLKLSCKADASARTRFAIEDGLRTSIPDETRFVLLRRMQVKGELAGAHPARRDQALREGWLSAITGARHGSEDGAPSANCVWFASREEAESLLLARLLAGRSVDAWYWKLALPNWRGRPLRAWLPECVAAALSENSPERLERIAQVCIFTGATQLLLDALGQAAEVPHVAPGLAATALETGEDAEIEKEAVATIAARCAERLAATISPLLRKAIIELWSHGPKARSAAFSIVKALLLRASPAVALSPPLLRSIISQAIEMISSRRAPRADQLPIRPSEEKLGSERDRPAARTEPSSIPGRRPSVQPRVSEIPSGIDSDLADLSELQSPIVSPKPIASPDWQRLASAHAGLWLIVPSLIDLGFREWVLKRADLLADNPGRRLFEAVAAHYRIALDDPVLAAFEGPSDPKEAAEWTRLWRCGLDRWLRRVARRRLHDLVGREGLLELGDRRLLVHFPAGTADLQLRRKALDRDPGWTDWLGLSIRYRFGGLEERP